MGLIVDLVCYVVLLAMLLLMTRVRRCERVQLNVNNNFLAGTILLCNQGVSGRVGLLNTPRLLEGDGLYLAGSRTVHTLGMHYPIDLVFLDESGRVLSTEESVAPGRRRVKGPRGTRSIIELGAGTVAREFRNLPPHAAVKYTVLGAVRDPIG